MPGMGVAGCPAAEAESDIISRMKDLSNVSAVMVEADQADQRIDNYLIRICKGVPRSHIYRILRTGEVRVNSRRVDATYRLAAGDQLRIPPIRIAERSSPPSAAQASRIDIPVLHEDGALIVVDKPSGVAVHGGSGVSLGVIEALRLQRPAEQSLELAHRLDRETSGLLLIAKSRAALRRLHQGMRDGQFDKRYLALAHGRWKGGERTVGHALRKYVSANGERRVSVDPQGQEARTVFSLVEARAGWSLMSARLLTGRTHQIRVHLAHLGMPIAGDDKYGDFALNRELARQGLKRMFLHAAELSFPHPLTGESVQFKAPLPEALRSFLDGLPKLAA